MIFSLTIVPKFFRILLTNYPQIFEFFTLKKFCFFFKIFENSPSLGTIFQKLFWTFVPKICENSEKKNFENFTYRQKILFWFPNSNSKIYYRKKNVCSKCLQFSVRHFIHLSQRRKYTHSTTHRKLGIAFFLFWKQTSASPKFSR